MKKALSVFLATLAVLSLASGAILLNADALPGYTAALPGFSVFTQAELEQLWTDKSGTVLTVTEGGIEAVLGASWRIGGSKFTPQTIGDNVTTFQDGMRTAVNGKSVFGDVDLSNKLTLKFKVTGFTGRIRLSFQQNAASVYADGGLSCYCHDTAQVRPDAQGYYTFDLRTTVRDWQNAEEEATEWSNLIHKINTVQVVFITLSTNYTTPITVTDWSVTANVDTDALYAAIKDLTERNGDEQLIAEATELYKDYTVTDQTAIDSMTVRLKAAAAKLPKVAKAPEADLLDVDFLGGQPRNTAPSGYTLHAAQPATFPLDGGKRVLATNRTDAKNSGFVFVNNDAGFYNNITDSATFEAVFKTNIKELNQSVISCTESGGFALEITPAGVLEIWCRDSATGSYTSYKPGYEIEAGRYYHVAATLSDKVFSLYIDGVLRDSVTIGGSIAYQYPVNFTLGGDPGREEYNAGIALDGYIALARIYTRGLSAQEIRENYESLSYSSDNENIQPVIDELTRVYGFYDVNEGNADAEAMIDSYVFELNAITEAYYLSPELIAAALRGSEFDAMILSAGGTVPEDIYETPVISGVADGGEYDVATQDAPAATWTPLRAAATLDGEPYIAGTPIESEGPRTEHLLIVTDGNKSSVARFTVFDSTYVYPKPVVTGVADDGVYDIFTMSSLSEYPKPAWTPEEATATLNGVPFESGTMITAVGEYSLVITNGNSETVVEFSIINSEPVYEMPEVSGVEEGGEYNLGNGIVRITFSPAEAFATLNGKSVDNGHVITAAGSYTLRVINGDKSLTVRFTAVGEHVHSYTTAVTPPTCTEGGYTTYTCECGDSYTGDETDPLGHDWGEWETVTPATHQEDGLEGHTCPRCDETETRPIPKLTFIRGDLDGSGEVTVIDALGVLRMAAGLAPVSDEALAVCDMNSDGNITVIDALNVLRIAAGLVSE